MHRPRSASPAPWWLALAVAGVAALAYVPPPARAATPSPALLGRLDPVLVPLAVSGTDSAAVWVEFSGKHASGPAAEIEALGGAWDRLTPRAQARRIRARMIPPVDVHDLPVAAEYLDALSARGLRPFAVSRWLNRAAVRVAASDLERIAALPFVARVAPVRRSRGPGDAVAAAELARGAGGGSSTVLAPERVAGAPVPSAQAGFTLRQLQQLGTAAVHDSGYIGTGVLVAVLDEGFNFHDKHQALRGQVLDPGFERDFVDGDTVATDTTSIGLYDHGTWTFGSLAGYAPGTYLGSAYGARFALGRTERDGSESPAEMLYWAQGAEWADSLGADVISSSVGYNNFDDPFPDLGPGDLDGRTSDIARAAEIAAARGILLVNSAGNGGAFASVRLASPADVHGDSLIAVGAVDSFGLVSSFSSRGPTSDGRIKPDLVARGVRSWLVSASGTPDAYTQGDGTSFATPLVAGLAACLLGARPSWTPTEVIRALRETAANACAPDNSQGWGIPDGAAALRWSPGPAAPALPPRGHLELVLQGPNPVVLSRGPARVRFGLGPRFTGEAEAHLRVFDVRGVRVRDLYLGRLCCGRWRVAEWNGDDGSGRRVRPGVYFVHFDAEGRTRTLRVVVLG